jgi:hypothetical protein
VDRIITMRQEGDTAHYLVKWEGLSYAEATWEADDAVAGAQGGLDAIDAYNQRLQRLQEASKGVDAQRAALNRKRGAGGLSKIEAQPDFLSGGQLRDYQLVGLNWMYKGWLGDTNGILADEMVRGRRGPGCRGSGAWGQASSRQGRGIGGTWQVCGTGGDHSCCRVAITSYVEWFEGSASVGKRLHAKHQPPADAVPTPPHTLLPVPACRAWARRCSV